MLALPVLLIRGWELVKQQTLGAAGRVPGTRCSAHAGFAGVLGRNWSSHKISLCSGAAAITITGSRDQSQDMGLARSHSSLSQSCSLRIPDIPHGVFQQWGTLPGLWLMGCLCAEGSISVGHFVLMMIYRGDTLGYLSLLGIFSPTKAWGGTMGCLSLILVNHWVSPWDIT